MALATNLSDVTQEGFTPIKLGFGLMRLPHKGVRTDVEQVKQMVDLFMQAGGTYFDTAFVYPGSEEATRKALVERYPRTSFTLATKLFAGAVPTASAAKAEFKTSLKRTGAGYFDYYLLHSLMESNYKKYDKFDLWDYVHDLQKDGLIRHFGFSFHGGPKLLDQILDAHPDVDFVQLQINYLDWDDDHVASRANYEVARSHNTPVVIMEPVKGGKLANPPAAAREIMRRYNSDASPSSWAIRFAASLPGVRTVLSGMSNIDQMRDNISYMSADKFQPLTTEERAALTQVRQIMGAASKATGEVPCTACRYCCEGCPKKISIPDIFAALNAQRAGYGDESARSLYKKALAAGSPASACIGCKQCERVCPQHISVIHELAAASAAFDSDGATR